MGHGVNDTIRIPIRKKVRIQPDPRHRSERCYRTKMTQANNVVVGCYQSEHNKMNRQYQITFCISSIPMSSNTDIPARKSANISFARLSMPRLCFTCIRQAGLLGPRTPPQRPAHVKFLPHFAPSYSSNKVWHTVRQLWRRDKSVCIRQFRFTAHNYGPVYSGGQSYRYSVTMLHTGIQILFVVFVTYRYYIAVTSNCSGTVIPKIRQRITSNSLHSFRKCYFVTFSYLQKSMLCNISFLHFFRNCCTSVFAL